MTPPRPKAPQTHGPAGRALIASITQQLSEDGLAPDARDRALLDVAAGLADRMAELQEMIALDGARSITPTGAFRMHPAIAEHRAHAAAMARVLGAVAMFEVSAKASNPAKVKAATTRWRSHNLAVAAERTRRAPSATPAVRGPQDGA